MKVGLATFNWEVNTSLAMWNLELYARKHPRIAEQVQFEHFCMPTPKDITNEEQQLTTVLRWAREQRCDVIGFSCYVWNIRFVNRLARALKELLPDTRIVYGGGQIRGYYVSHVLEREPFVDVCIEGEGEIAFRDLLLHWLGGDDAPALADIKGLGYRGPEGALVRTGPARIVEDINDIPSPYEGAVSLPLGGAFLLEASRGCPYRCSYCIWGKLGAVRDYDMDRVEREIEFVLAHQPSHIMFTDATFNFKKPRAKRIVSILLERLTSGAVAPFSGLFENKLELIDAELADMYDRLLAVNPLFTFEFGLQSANALASKLMQRPFSQRAYRKAWDLLSPRLRSMAIVDCIYGLPGDTAADFKATVDFAWSLAPHRIQCFRLAILPGSEYESHVEEYGIRFSREPDHLVYETKWVSFDEMIALQAFGFAVSDVYHFHRTTLKCLVSGGESFSALVSRFVDHVGVEAILETLGGMRPEGRWRGIDLSALFADFVLNHLLGDDCAPERRKRHEDLLRYERALGQTSFWSEEQSSDDGATRLATNAVVVRTQFDIPMFVRSVEAVVEVDIMTMKAKPCHIALTSSTRSGHAGVRFPTSYNIPEQYDRALTRFSTGEAVDQVVSALTAPGTEAPYWHAIIAKLRTAGLLVPAPAAPPTL